MSHHAPHVARKEAFMTKDIAEILQFVPSFQDWNTASQNKDDWHSYCSYITRIDQTLCLLPVIWPQFVEIEELILIKNKLPEDWSEYLTHSKQANWSASTIEYMVNHIHIADLFMNDPDYERINTAVLLYIAQYIAEMWRCRLQQLFPYKKFSVGVGNEEEDPEVYAYTIRDTP